MRINPRKIREIGAWPDSSDFNRKVDLLVSADKIRKIPKKESATGRHTLGSLPGQLGGTFEQMLASVLNAGKPREYTPDEFLSRTGKVLADRTSGSPDDGAEGKNIAGAADKDKFAEGVANGIPAFGDDQSDAAGSALETVEEYRIPYQMIRSGRATISIEIGRDCNLVFRAPMRTKTRDVEELARKHFPWIVQHMAKKLTERENGTQLEELSQDERKQKVNAFVPVLKERLQYYAGRMGVTYGRVSIRNQRTRWGSCSAKGNLNFNWRLSILPEELRDYVIVHELAHRKEMNHSASFWAIVESILPDYKERRKKLKEYHI